MLRVEEKTDRPRSRTGAAMKRPLSPTSPHGHHHHDNNGPPDTGPRCRHRANDADDADPRAKRERKQRGLTLCEVCNIQLNSSAQAQIHYNGKTHQRRLRQARNNSNTKGGGGKSNAGGAAQGSPLLTSLLPTRPPQPHMELKHLVPLQINTASPLSLFPNFHTMDPVQKAVISHTFGLPQPLKKKHIISCNICHLRFNSTNQAEAHYKGHKHARKIKALDNQKHKLRGQGGRERERERRKERDRDGDEMKTGRPSALMDGNTPERTEPLTESHLVHEKRDECLSVALPVVSNTPPGSHGDGDTGTEPPEIKQASEPAVEEEKEKDDEKDKEKERKNSKSNLHCPVCKVTVNSSLQMEAHYSGAKHKLMLEGQCVQPRRRGGKVASSRMSPRPKRHGNKSGSSGPAAASVATGQSHHCDVCNITVNSDIQLKQHMSSRRHKDRLAGKPPKPKFSPYNPSSASSLIANIGLAGLSAGTGSALGGVYHPYNLTTITPQTKLALQKELSKTLTAGFLPSPLTQAALCTMATNPLTLRHAPGPTAIIQTPMLSPALFRPAPGPLRAAHAPIIFSPY